MRLNDIRERYGIGDVENLEQIKTELKRRVKENHPDNNGNFNSDYFVELKEDLDYVESLLKASEITLIPANEVIKMLTEVLQVPSKQDNTKKDKLETELSVSVDNQILTIKKRSFIPKFSSASVLAVITLLWMFPDQVIKHPLMSIIFYNLDIEDYVVTITWLWFLVLVFTGFFWVRAICDEKIEKEIVAKLKLENVQDRIFMKFLKNISNEYFTKQEFMEYLSYIENIEDRWGLKKSYILPFYHRQFQLQEEVIQNMADIILLRAKEYGVIKAAKPHGLIDRYKIILEDE